MSERYPTAAAIRSICEKFDLKLPDKYTQDWEHEASDPKVVSKLLDGYEHMQLNEDEKFALMAVLLSSFDDAVQMDMANEAMQNRIVELLKKDCSIHHSHIDYWSSWDHSDEELQDAFAISPIIRNIARTD